MSLNIKTDSGSIKIADVGGNGSFILGTFKALWTATYTSAVNVKLTETLTLAKGKYLCMVQIPTSSSATGGDSLYLNGTNLQLLISVVSYSNSVFLIDVEQDNSTLELRSSSSNATTYSNLQRGFLQAIRLA